ncbi:SulP family inorganic anion transporter, partial [Francisella tularensis]|nr:SulP family inorganic anion transporter [Francisella tularensis]
MAGVLHVLIWILCLCKLLRVVPPTVLYGFVNGSVIVNQVTPLPIFTGDRIDTYVLVGVIYLFY